MLLFFGNIGQLGDFFLVVVVDVVVVLVTVMAIGRIVQRMIGGSFGMFAPFINIIECGGIK